MNLKRILVLFTDAYPFDNREPHLKDEVNYLFNDFEKVYIFSTCPQSKILFDLPSNAKAFRVPVSLQFFQKFWSFRFIFSDIFVKESSFIKKSLHTGFSFYKIKIFLAELSKANILFKFVEHELKNELHGQNLIYIYSFWNNYKAIAAAFLKIRYPEVKAFSRAHGWDVYFERHPENYLPGKPFIVNYLDAIYYVSKNGLEYSHKKFGSFPNLKLSRLGSFNNFRPKIIKTRDPFHLVSCSSLIPLKRVDLIIESLSLLNDKYLFKWTHIGDGPLMDALKIKTGELLAEKKNISYNYIGFISKKEVKEYYANNVINLFINVSSTEGIPISIMEAMSFAIPVIATNVGGNSEIVSGNQNGTLLSENPDPEEISGAIEKYIEMDENKYFTFCKAAYETWNEKFNAEKNYPAFIEEIFKL